MSFDASRNDCVTPTRATRTRSCTGPPPRPTWRGQRRLPPPPAGVELRVPPERHLPAAVGHAVRLVVHRAERRLVRPRSADSRRATPPTSTFSCETHVDRYDWVKIWDNRISKRFGLSAAQTIEGMLDIFNTANINTITSQTNRNGSAYLQPTEIIAAARDARRRAVPLLVRPVGRVGLVGRVGRVAPPLQPLTRSLAYRPTRLTRPTQPYSPSTRARASRAASAAESFPHRRLQRRRLRLRADAAGRVARSSGRLRRPARNSRRVPGVRGHVHASSAGSGTSTTCSSAATISKTALPSSSTACCSSSWSSMPTR